MNRTRTDCEGFCRREIADRLLCKLVQQARIPTLGIRLEMQDASATNGVIVHLLVTNLDGGEHPDRPDGYPSQG